MHTTEFTSDSCNSLKNCSTLYYMSIFNITLYVFYYFLSVLISYWVHLFHNIFYFILYVCIFFTNQLQYITLLHIQWCMVYVIYITYIYEIYTLAWILTVSYTLQSANIVIPKTILECITDICHEMNQ